jgi:hypothetical protein
VGAVVRCAEGVATDALAVGEEDDAPKLVDGTITAVAEAAGASAVARPDDVAAFAASLVGRAASLVGRMNTTIATTTPSKAAAPSASPTRAPEAEGASIDVGEVGGGVAPEAGPSAVAGGATASFVLS